MNMNMLRASGIKDLQKWRDTVDLWGETIKTNSHPVGTVALNGFEVKSCSNSPMRW